MVAVRLIYDVCTFQISADAVRINHDDSEAELRRKINITASIKIATHGYNHDNKSKSKDYRDCDIRIIFLCYLFVIDSLVCSRCEEVGGSWEQRLLPVLR